MQRVPYLLAFVLVAGIAEAKAQTDAAIKAAITGHTISGFTLKSVKVSSGVQENWMRASDGAQLTIKVLSKQNPNLVTAKVNALNKTVKAQDELLFRCETHGTTMAWTNYRADHGATFRTYRYLRLEGPLLVEQSVTFPKPPPFDKARLAFVTMRKTATDLFKRLALIK